MDTLTLQDILNDVAQRVPNNVPVAQQVTWINQRQRRLFRNYRVPDTVANIATQPGMSLYAPPADFAPDKVQSLTVDTKRLEYQRLDEDAKDHFWTIVAGEILIWPTPASAGTMLIYYTPRPVDLSPNNLLGVPNFPADFHDLLVIHCAKMCAQSQRDVPMVNNLEAEYQEVAAEAKKFLDEPFPRPRTAKATVPWM